MPTNPNGFYLGLPGSERLLSANDARLTEPVEDNVRESRTAGGTLVRYKPTLHKIRHWQFAYSWLPGQDMYVYDRGLGFNSLLALKLADNVMNLITPTDSAGPVTFSVRFMAGSWQPGLIMRSGDFWARSLNFELVQVS